MKHIINLKPREKLLLNDMEKSVKDARNSNDYVLINFGRKGEFIKIAFCKDQTYCIGYNFWNMEFSVKTNVMLKQYRVTNVVKIATYITDWINRLNRKKGE